MAYLQADEKLQQDPNNAQAQAQAQLGGQPSSVAPMVGGGSSQVGSGVSTAGTKAGGTGGWTNIQAYLNANKQDTGSAQTLQSKVGSEFDKEKSNLQNKATETANQAVSQADTIKKASDTAQQYIDQAGQAYNWGGQQNDQYNTAKSTLSNAIRSEYQGPKNFQYGLGNQSQQYASALGSNEAFDQFMGDIYQQNAGGKLSSGGRELQKQLDVNNSALADTKNKLLSQWSGLNQFRDQTIADTDKKIRDAEQGYRVNQSALKDYLSNRAGTLESDIAKQESDAKKEYETLLAEGPDKNKEYADYYNKYKIYAPPTDLNVGDVWGQDKSARGLIDHAQRGYLGAGNVVNGHWDKDTINSAIDSGNWGEVDKAYKERTAAQGGDPSRASYEDIKDFFKPYIGAREYDNSLNKKYSNTADKEERQFNFLSDLLGLAKTKEQGFKVRG